MSTTENEETLKDGGFDLIILGGGLAALAAGYAATKRGEKPLILEERGRPGGLVCEATFAGVTVDIGAESYATRTPEVSQLCQELGLETTAPNGNSWIWDHERDDAVRIPFGTLGIPADLDDPIFVEGLRSVAGETAVQRARQDLTLPAQIGADAQTLAELVVARMGQAVLDTFVTPFAGGIYSAHPKNLSLDRVGSELKTAFTHTGTLSAAVAATRKPGSAAVLQPRGGMYQLVHALTKKIESAGGRIDSHVRVVHLESGIGAQLPRWVVWCKHTVSNRKTPGGEPEEVGTAFGLAADRVILALPPNQAMRILNSAAASMIRLSYHAQKEGRDTSLRFDREALEKIGDLSTNFEMHRGTPVLNVTLVVNSPALDKAPRGSGLLVGPPPNHPNALRAKAITHYSVKWPDTMNGAVKDHTHVLRVSYGREGDPEGFLDTIDVSRALADASRMLGVKLSETDLLDSRRINWGDAMTHPNQAERKLFKQVEEAAKQVAGLDLVGSWVAGNGITPVVAHGLRTG